MTTTTDRQLTIDGAEVPYPLPTPRRLNPRQRELWLYAALAPGGFITTGQASRFYADPSGALRRLEDFGVMRRLDHGRWRAV
jgi:hypothetical protein